MADAGKPDVDGGWAWWVFIGSFMNLLLASGIAFVSGIFQKLFLEEFGESVAFTAWVTALFSSLMQLAGESTPTGAWHGDCSLAVVTTLCSLSPLPNLHGMATVVSRSSPPSALSLLSPTFK